MTDDIAAALIRAVEDLEDEATEDGGAVTVPLAEFTHLCAVAARAKESMPA